MIKLIPIAIGIANTIRMATPNVAKNLIKSGIGKKPSKSALDKLGSTPKRISAKDANKLVSRSKPSVRTKTGAARKPPKTPTQKKIDKAKTGDALVPAKSKSVATRPGTAVATRPGTAVATRPSSAVTKVKGSKPSKGKSLLKKIGIGAGLIAGGAAINEALDKNKSVKSKTKTSPAAKRKVTSKSKTSPDDVMRKERDNVKKIKGGVKTSDVTIKKSKIPDYTGRKGKIATADKAMSMGEYLEGAVGMRGAKGLEGAKRKVKTPFGTLTFDTSDDAFEPDVENKAGGRIKRQAGGKVRGVGQAIKGFGKAAYSDKMF